MLLFERFLNKKIKAEMSSLSLIHTVISSAYAVSFTGGISGNLGTTSPCNRFLKDDKKGSIDIEYNSPERGHPCRMPLVTAKGLVRQPLILSILDVSLYNNLTQETNCGPNPKAFKVFSKYKWSTLSKAFSWSRDKSPISIWCFLATVIMSLRKNRLSKIVLLGIQYDWSSWIIVAIHFFNLLVIAFDSILKSVHSNETGRQFFKSPRSFFLAIKVSTTLLQLKVEYLG